MLSIVKLDNTLLTCDQDNSNQIGLGIGHDFEIFFIFLAKRP